MKYGILRDVVAGCAGVVVVAAVIGFPKPADPAAPGARPSGQHVVLLPFYSGLGSGQPRHWFVAPPPPPRTP